MNILHVVPTFVPCFSAGGVVNASYQIAKKQKEAGHNVTVYTTDYCKKRLKQDNHHEIYDGIDVYYFKNISNSFKTKFTIDTPLTLPGHLRKNIDKFDIIHIHEHRHSLAIATHRYAKKKNIPYVLQAHGSVLPFFQKEKMKEVFDKIWGFDILYDACKVFALTEVEKEQYLTMGVDESKIEIVPLGINIEEYEKLPEKGKFKSRYNIDTNEKLIVFLGRIHEIKGLDLLIKAFNRISGENVKLAIIGGDYGFLDDVEVLIKEYHLEDKVIFPGVLTGEDKKEALVDCDIFVMPSRYESFTTSGLEAMACYKPLVLTKNNHIHDWVENTVGLTCEFDDAELADCLKKLLDNEELCKKFGQNGRQLINDIYDWDKIENQILKIYITCSH